MTNAMGGLDEEDDGYSDDDLDALPDHAFDELQDYAVKSTQQPANPAQLPNVSLPPRSGPAGVASGTGRTTLGLSLSNAAGQHIAQPSSDYGDFDDEMLDGEIFDAAEDPAFAAEYEARVAENRAGEVSQREEWRQQRYGPSLPNARGARHNQPWQQGKSNEAHFTNDAATRVLQSDGQGTLPNPRPSSDDASNTVDNQPPVNETADVDALRAQVQELLRERETLNHSIRTANEIAFAKAGEIAIVRANIAKVEKEYENRTNSMQKIHADEAARQKIEVEKARAELHKIATEKDFLENDLAEGTKQIRNLQKAVKKGNEEVAGKGNQPRTPKKNKNLPLRDGFEDDEVQPMSPSKLALRSKAHTPKGGVNRKRKAGDDSPVKPLDLAQAEATDSFESNEQDPSKHEVPAGTQAPKLPDQRFYLIQQLLDHRIDTEAESEEPRTLERLADYKFPSQPSKPLSTLLLDEMSTLTHKPDIESFPSALGLIIISMWSRSMEEKYHQPVHLLVDLIQFILVLNPIRTAPDLTNELMNLVQSTADIILVPRCQKKPPRKDKADLDSTPCLEIIQMMAVDCQCDEKEITRFWRTMRFDFIMMLLNFINPLAEIHIMLSILHTSILDESFAMIVPPNNGQQDASEAHIIDNLSHLLINTPRPAADEDPPDAAELCTLRLDVIGLFNAMCDTTHSAEALAKHRLVIGYLVRVMNDELNHVYDHKYGHELRITLVNEATRLLFHLTSNFAEMIDMKAKLSVVPGGEKKILIVLTRLAFSEGGFYEQDIEDDVVDCAHQMLEARVSPEEAESLVAAFSSAPVSRKDADDDAPSREPQPAEL